MAEEVGAAFVSLVPSARGFSTKVRAEIRKDMAGKDIAVPITPEVDRAKVRAALAGATAGERGTIPIATRVDPGQLRREVRVAVLETQATRPSVTIHTTVDGSSLRRAFAGLDGDIGRGGSGLGRTFSSAFINNVVFSKFGLIVGLTSVLSIPGASLTAAATLLGVTLGGAVLGGFALRNDPLIRKTASEFMSRLNAGLTRAAQPLKVPILEAMETLFKTLKGLEPDIRAMFQAIAPFIPQLAEGVSGFLKAFTPDLVNAVKASAPVIEQLSLALPDLGDGLGQFLTSMALVAPQAATFFGQFLRLVADLLRGLGQVIGFLTRLSDKFVAFLKFVGEIAKEVVLGWGIILQATRNFVGNELEVVDFLIGKIKPVWDGFWRHLIPNYSSIGLSAVVSQMRALPGRIASTLGNLRGVLFQAGRNIMQSLIDGIRSRFPSLSDVMSTAASMARSYWPFSPAKQGPLSGRGSLFYAGQNLVGDLAGGMRSKLPVVSSASDQLAGAVGTGLPGRGGSAVAATSPTFVFDSAGMSGLDALFLDWLQGKIRHRGGNVQVALGS